MTAGELKKLIRDGETATVEFKRARGGIPSDFWPSYSAFANTDGGIIVLGVREENGKREIEGLTDAEKIKADLWNAANNDEKISANVLTNSSVRSVWIKGKWVVVVNVPRAARTDRPVYVGADVFKGAYRRNGEGDYRCSREAVEAMIRDKCAETADNCVLEDMTLSDLDEDSVRRYRMIFQNRRPEHAWNKLTDEAFLCKIGAAKMDKDGAVRPLLAGLLCFGDFVTIMGVLPDYFLDYREKVDDGTRWKDRVAAHDANWSGNIVDFYFRIYDRLTSDVKVPFALDDEGRRINETKVHKALRELLANALIHADYHGRRGIVIEKHYETISFRNPGGLRMSRELAIAGGNSDARNARIFNIFALIDVGERSGMGLSNLYSVWEEYGYARPLIEELHEPEQTVVTVDLKTSKIGKTRGKKTRGKNSETRGKETSTKAEKTSTKNLKSSTKDSDLPPEEIVVLRLTSNLVVEEMRRNPAITREDLAQRLRMTLSGINWQVAKLQKDKIIRRVGGRKFGQWEVLI